MTDSPQTDRAKQLAEDHADWLVPVLRRIYVDAGVHFYGHGRADAEREAPALRPAQDEQQMFDGGQQYALDVVACAAGWPNPGQDEDTLDWVRRCLAKPDAEQRDWKAGYETGLSDVMHMTAEAAGWPFPAIDEAVQTWLRRCLRPCDDGKPCTELFEDIERLPTPEDVVCDHAGRVQACTACSSSKPHSPPFRVTPGHCGNVGCAVSEVLVAPAPEPSENPGELRECSGNDPGTIREGTLICDHANCVPDCAKCKRAVSHLSTYHGCFCSAAEADVVDVPVEVAP